MPPDSARQPGLVWLVGMMGAGKTTVGRELARLLGRPFVDLDERIAEEAGHPVPSIISEQGEPAFRELERAAVRRLAELSPGSPEADAVVATGGGAPCFGDSLERMERSGVLVWLRVEADEALRAMEQGEGRSTRPLLAGTEVEARRRWVGIEAERRATYARASLRLDRAGRAPEKLAQSIASWLADYGEASLGLDLPRGARSLWLQTPSAGYRITLARSEEGFAEHLARLFPPGRTRVGLVTDETVGRLHLARYRRALERRGYGVVEVRVPEGEGSKSMAEAARVADALASGGLDRQGVVVALGGGVVGDLAGFVAATLFRGVACVQVPTTLLAMVDSSVGGKTGVNLPTGKNLAGSFHQPALVWMDFSSLETLPPRDLSAGLAEVAKHALLAADGALWGELVAHAERARAGDPETLAALVETSCRIKAAVVGADEHELREDGGRMLLNLGHTVGHALESASHKLPDHDQALRHGEAVTLGLVAAARITARLDREEGVAGEGCERELVALLGRLGLPTDLDGWLARLPGALARIAVDKKRARGLVRFIAVRGPSQVRVVPLPPERLVALLGS